MTGAFLPCSFMPCNALAYTANYIMHDAPPLFKADRFTPPYSYDVAAHRDRKGEQWLGVNLGKNTPRYDRAIFSCSVAVSKQTRQPISPPCWLLDHGEPWPRPKLLSCSSLLCFWPYVSPPLSIYCGESNHHDHILCSSEGNVKSILPVIVGTRPGDRPLSMPLRDYDRSVWSISATSFFPSP